MVLYKNTFACNDLESTLSLSLTTFSDIDIDVHISRRHIIELREATERLVFNAGSTLAEYFSQDDTQNLITQNGWSLTAKDEGSLNFSTDQAEVMIDIVDQDNTPATQYQILYTPIEGEE